METFDYWDSKVIEYLRISRYSIRALRIRALRELQMMKVCDLKFQKEVWKSFQNSRRVILIFKLRICYSGQLGLKTQL